MIGCFGLSPRWRDLVEPINSLGQQLQQESMLLLRNIIVANYRTDKSTTINDCLVQQEIIKVFSSFVQGLQFIYWVSI